MIKLKYLFSSLFRSIKGSGRYDHLCERTKVSGVARKKGSPRPLGRCRFSVMMKRSVSSGRNSLVAVVVVADARRHKQSPISMRSESFGAHLWMLKERFYYHLRAFLITHFPLSLLSSLSFRWSLFSRRESGRLARLQQYLLQLMQR